MQPLTYFFILGRNPKLSLAEIYAILPKEYKVTDCSREALLVEDRELDLAVLMKRLGGTIKIGKIMRMDMRMFARDYANAMASLVSKNLLTNKKIYFGLSAYRLEEKICLPSIQELHKLGIEVKRKLQNQGYKVRFVTSGDYTLSSVIVKKEKLLTQGAEIVLLYPRDHIILGKTLAVQEFEEASIRDFGRPAREMKVGILPIQLAKIMINLARAPFDATILDPFCGFGTILVEAALMGYQNIIGSDANPQAIASTKQNLEWLSQKFQIPKSKIQIFQSDVRYLSKKLSLRSVDAIVTEPYLGPTKIIGNWGLEIGNLNKELSALYFDAFQEFKKILKPNGRVVFIFPAFKHNGWLIKTSETVLPKIKNLGFKPISLLPLTLNSKFRIQNSEFSILYSRPNQKVLREIFVFTLF